MSTHGVLTESGEDSEDEDRKTENAADMFKKTEPVVSKKPDTKADDVSSCLVMYW